MDGVFKYNHLDHQSCSKQACATPRGEWLHFCVLRTLSAEVSNSSSMYVCNDSNIVSLPLNSPPRYVGT